MFRYFLYLTYNGTRYCGWQRQPFDTTVQQVVEQTLSRLYGVELPVTGAGRTDTGVHARMMTAHFDLPTVIEEPEKLVAKLNSMLPKDIAVSKIALVTEKSHARFSAISRTYQYSVTNRKDPFNYEYVCYMSLRNIEFEKMNAAAQLLLEYNDFTSFSKLHTDVKTNICHIKEACWQQKAEVWLFTITADRFLRNMVRAIVGTLFAVGRGKISLDGFKEIIEAKDCSKASSSARPEGLSLVNIEYPSQIFL
jgi:tRNA pseudouridine38-40 synthase